MTAGRRSTFTLAALFALAAFGCGSEAIAGPETAMPVFAESGTCSEWACEEYICGYDTGSDPRGACCVEPAPQGQAGDPKPSCDPGGGPPDASCDPNDYGAVEVNFCYECGAQAACCYWFDPASALHSCY